MANSADFIGLFPAAGHATRLQHLSGSKEIIQVPDIHGQPGSPTIAVGDYLLRQYRDAGIKDVVVIRRQEKTDIPDHLSSPDYHDLNIIDIVTEPTPDTSHTLDRARLHTRHRPVAMGFPDIIVDPPDVFRQLKNKLLDSGTEICLSLFPPGDPFKWDRVETANDRVVSIMVKPGESARDTLSWGSVVWQPVFTEFLHEYLAGYEGTGEAYVGHILQAAIDAGMSISTVAFPDGSALDIGTPDDLERARTGLW